MEFPAKLVELSSIPVEEESVGIQVLDKKNPDALASLEGNTALGQEQPPPLFEPLVYRREIDGLRGFAVIPVVLHHYHLGFSGGYTGVDVFFVIRYRACRF
jgi:hypothetical protein